MGEQFKVKKTPSPWCSKKSYAGRFLDLYKPYGLCCKYSPCINTMFMDFVLKHEKMVRTGKKAKRQAIALVPQQTSPPFPQENLHSTCSPPGLGSQAQKWGHKQKKSRPTATAAEIGPWRFPEDCSRAMLGGESRHTDQPHRQGRRGGTGGDTGRRRKSLWFECLQLSPSKSLCVTTRSTMDDCSLNRKTTLHVF